MSTQPLLQRTAKKRIALPVRLEPKVFFANERTFLSCLQFAVAIDWAVIQKVADRLRCGDVRPWEIGTMMRRRAYELLTVEEAMASGDEDRMVKWMREEAERVRPVVKDGNGLTEQPVALRPAWVASKNKPSLTWSCPTLNLTFTPPASSASTIFHRTFSFPPLTYTLSPCTSPATAPHLVSLIAAAPCLTDLASLDITLDDAYPGSGGVSGLSDAYRGVLRCAGGWDERRVVVKLTCPTAHGEHFAQETDPEYGETGARLGAMEEAGLYAREMAALQQTTVPVYYGTWVMRRRLGGWMEEGETDKEEEIVAVVLEDVGETSVEPWTPVTDTPMAQRKRILDHIARLNSHNVLYKPPPVLDTSRFRAGPDGQGRIVGFSRSNYSPWGCTQELRAIGMNWGLSKVAERQARDKVAREVAGLREYLEMRESVDDTLHK